MSANLAGLIIVIGVIVIFTWVAIVNKKLEAEEKGEEFHIKLPKFFGLGDDMEKYENDNR